MLLEAARVLIDFAEQLMLIESDAVLLLLLLLNNCTECTQTVSVSYYYSLNRIVEQNKRGDKIKRSRELKF